LTIPLGHFDPIRGSLTLVIECGEFDFVLAGPANPSFSVPVGPKTNGFQSGVATAGFGSIRYTSLDVVSDPGGVDHFLEIENVKLTFSEAQQQAHLSATVTHTQLGTTRINYAAYLVMYMGGVIQTTGGTHQRVSAG
jgi:hypothetical protein